MAYFLKVTKPNGKDRKYLQIYESKYDGIKKGTIHKSYRAIGYEDKLIESGIANPIEYYKKEVDKLNNSFKSDKDIKIDKSPVRYIGYFPLVSIMNKLKIKKTVDLFKYTTNYSFDLYDMLSALIYSRSVNPCSKYKTCFEVIPQLYSHYDFSYDQLLEGLSFFGNDYEKFVELFTYNTKEVYGINTNTTYFDCTNFYFEIDREDDFRKKGPSKENRPCPLVGLGLLLDNNQIPIGMKLYPGNESEKPVLREVINDLKRQNNIEGRTIHVADKGLNCSENILNAKKGSDGYLFSKSVKQLPEVELTWVLLDNDYKTVKDKEGNILYKYKECVDTFPYNYKDDKGKLIKINLTEKRVVTYNPTLAKKQIYEINKLVEKAKGLYLCKVKKEEYGESSKYVNFKGKDGSKVEVTINEEKINKDKRLAGYNLLVTSEVNMKAKDIYDTYHNLWRIEESFKIMKSDLDARPVYLQKEETIKGHFLICYLAVLLERIFQFKILDNKVNTEKIYEFFKGYKYVEGTGRYINISSKSWFIDYLTELTGLPLNNLNLSEAQLKKVFNHKF